jgi:hypothetical protein
MLMITPRFSHRSLNHGISKVHGKVLKKQAKDKGKEKGAGALWRLLFSSTNGHASALFHERSITWGKSFSNDIFRRLVQLL